MSTANNNWREENNTLIKEFSFSNFKEALHFVNRVGEICEELNHHPNILLHNYRLVTISTTTHDAGNKITELDYTITQKIDEL